MAIADFLEPAVKDYATQATATYSAPINTGAFTGRQFVAGEDPLQTKAIDALEAARQTGNKKIAKQAENFAKHCEKKIRSVEKVAKDNGIKLELPLESMTNKVQLAHKQLKMQLIHQAILEVVEKVQC